MKSYSRAAKRRNRRGRPKIEGEPREPNGRISRSGVDHDPADRAPLEVRSRLTGLPVDLAKDQRAATFVGYLAILGRRDGLSRAQYDALESYKRLREAYLRAIKAPSATYNGPPTGDEDGYAAWCRATIKRYGECKKAIQQAQNDDRSENLWAALDLCVLRDQRLPHMIGAVRLLANALVRFSGWPVNSDE